MSAPQDNVDDDYSSSSDSDWEVPADSAAGQQEPNAYETARSQTGTGYDILAKEDDILLGKQCVVVLTLPDGSTKEHKEFRMGHTVEHIKYMLEEKYGIKYSKSTLFLGGTKRMIDPLSLSDIPLSDSQPNPVTVKED
eukprot:TRINITY_DN113701_c0_g1_i1.p2 TRINITY_DN113701_c0_g1~~TRINITY_DN113701_c0_g1_i1.p2  ORF type:complete len:138 (-),score=13.61 TRINITY_DN113701_c0_g1_i1:96-509(-)